MAIARKIISKTIIIGISRIFQAMFIQLIFTKNRRSVNRMPDTINTAFEFVFSLIGFILGANDFVGIRFEALFLKSRQK